MSIVLLPDELLVSICEPLQVAELLSLSVQCKRLRCFIQRNPRLFWFKYSNIAHKTGPRSTSFIGFAEDDQCFIDLIAHHAINKTQAEDEIYRSHVETMH